MSIAWKNAPATDAYDPRITRPEFTGSNPLKQPSRCPPVALALAAMLALALSLSSCSHAASPQPVESITIGAPAAGETVIPVFVAQDRGFFAANDLSVAIKPYDTGLATVAGLLKGEVDVASTVSDYVFARQVLQDAPVQALASLDKGELVFLVARKDRGIQTIMDLSGKRIGIPSGTAAEFYLSRFLALNGLSAGSVTIVDEGTLAAGIDRLAGGDLDAVATIDPYSHAAQARLGDNALVWPLQSSQPSYALLVAGSVWIKQHPRTVERLLRAVGQAEDDMARHPEAARAVAKQRLGLTDADVAAIWARNDFTISLDMGLVAAMEDEARWMIQNKLVANQQVPDFMQHIDADWLKSVEPAAVNLSAEVVDAIQSIDTA